MGFQECLESSTRVVLNGWRPYMCGSSLSEKCWIRNLWDSMTLWWLYDDSMMTLWWLYDDSMTIYGGYHCPKRSGNVWHISNINSSEAAPSPGHDFLHPVCARRCLHTLGPWDPGTLCPGCRWSEGRCGVAQLCSSHCPKRSPHWVCHVLLFVQRLTFSFLIWIWRNLYLFAPSGLFSDAGNAGKNLDISWYIQIHILLG